VYKAPTLELAYKEFEAFQNQWGKKYPKEVASWEQNLDVLLTFLKYPTSIRSVIYTTNWIERTNKDFRKRLRPMNSLPDITAAEKIVFLTVLDYNEKWATRKLRGFAEAHQRLQEMFQERYGKCSGSIISISVFARHYLNLLNIRQ
jgi:putative transposase